MLWIGILAFVPTPPPLRFDPSLVGAVTGVGAKVLIEDYSRLDADGVPIKTWLG